MKKQENNQDMESTKKSFLSMGFSLALVICVLLFIFGFKHFLKGREYQGNAVQKEAESSTQDIHKEYLDTDKTFQSGYIMIKDVPKKGIYTSKLPGEKKKKGAVFCRFFGLSGEMAQSYGQGRLASCTGRQTGL